MNQPKLAQPSPQEASDASVVKVQQNSTVEEKEARQLSTENKSEENGDVLITWNGYDDPENPKNWSTMRKWKAIFAMSSFAFMSPLSSTIIAPALPAIASSFNITQSAVQKMVLSILLLGFALGPLVASPLSEIYGRVRVVQSWNLLYIVFNAACGGVQTKEAIIILRFMAGACGSATLGIGGGTLSDLFKAKDRGKAVAIHSWSPILAPLVGAVIGGFISQHTTWRWNFYASSLLSVAIQLSGLLFLEETYPPLLLRRKKRKLQKETGATNLYTKFDHLDAKPTVVLRTNLARPFRLTRHSTHHPSARPLQRLSLRQHLHPLRGLCRSLDQRIPRIPPNRRTELHLHRHRFSHSSRMLHTHQRPHILLPLKAKWRKRSSQIQNSNHDSCDSVSVGRHVLVWMEYRSTSALDHAQYRNIDIRRWSSGLHHFHQCLYHRHLWSLFCKCTGYCFDGSLSGWIQFSDVCSLYVRKVELQLGWNVARSHRPWYRTSSCTAIRQVWSGAEATKSVCGTW